MKSSKINNIQALRGIAVLGVVFYHSLIIEKKYSVHDSILPQFLSIGMSGVDLFFVISGFVMVAVTRDAFQQPKLILRFAYHRITRIYPLYWFYSLLVLSVYLLQPSMINSSQSSQHNLIASFLLLPDDLVPLLAVGWTLVHEMYFYFIFIFLLFLPAASFTLGIMLWAVTIAVCYFFPLTDNNPFYTIFTHPLTYEFIAGCLVAQLYYKNIIIANSKVILLAALFLWVGGYTLYVTITGNFEVAFWPRVFLFGIPAALIVYSLTLLEKNHNFLLPCWLLSIGNASYSIYLSHVLVLSLVGKIWYRFAYESSIDNLIVFSVMLYSVLLAGLISHRLLEKPILQLSRKFEKYLF